MAPINIPCVAIARAALHRRACKAASSPNIICEANIIKSAEGIAAKAAHYSIGEIALLAIYSGILRMAFIFHFFKWQKSTVCASLGMINERALGSAIFSNAMVWQALSYKSAAIFSFYKARRK